MIIKNFLNKEIREHYNKVLFNTSLFLSISITFIPNALGFPVSNYRLRRKSVLSKSNFYIVYKKNL